MRGEPLLDLRDSVSCCGEQGLLSVAFHPDYASNGRLFVDYTDVDGDTRVVEFHADPAEAVAEPDSARELLAVDQPFSNHNGGQLAFGPDGLLYVGMGDGGGSGDPDGNAPGPREPAGEDPHARRGRVRRRLAGGRVRPAESLALLVRPRGRHALRRRRGAGTVGGDRRGRVAGRRGRELRLERRSRAAIRSAAARRIPRGRSSIRSPSTATTRAPARSRAGSSTAARRCRGCRAATSTGTTARARSSRSACATAARRRRGRRRSRSRGSPRSGRTRRGELYLVSGDGLVYRLVEG